MSLWYVDTPFIMDLTAVRLGGRLRSRARTKHIRAHENPIDAAKGAFRAIFLATFG